MKYINLKFDLNITNLLRVGEVVLNGSTGNKYINKALHVPGYGWVPCSKALCDKFTNDPKHLVLVISEADDIYKPVTSDIWVTRTGLIRRLGLENESVKHETVDSEAREMAPNIKVCTQMSARALVISENSVLQFIEGPKRDKKGAIVRDKEGCPVQEITFVCGTKKGYVSPAAKSILNTGTIDDFQYAEVSIDGKTPIPCILKTKRKQ
jgi:hypothetical protein